MGDHAFGNKLFRIASVIGIAVKNGYDYGFPVWNDQQYFVNPLPVFEKPLKQWKMRKTFDKFDFGFQGFDIPDGRDVVGELGSYKYFEHCDDLIKHYFTLSQQSKIEGCIFAHYRNYNNPAWANLAKEYYLKALKYFPKKQVCVVTDDIQAAYKVLGNKFLYTSNTPIVDFGLLCSAQYLIMANSTFSWWAAYLSGAETVAPKQWYAGVLKDAPTNDLYLPNWKLI